jgi:hypothetical protein
MHKDYVFLCPSPNEVVPVPHDVYVALMRKQQSLTQHAGQQVRLAILYVAMHDGRPVEAVNAHYSLLDFDEAGYASPHGGSFSPEQNQAFWQAVEQSRYDDVDYDPQVQKLRREMHDEFSWVPSQKEQSLMLDIIFRQDDNA